LAARFNPLLSCFYSERSQRQFPFPRFPPPIGCPPPARLFPCGSSLHIENPSDPAGVVFRTTPLPLLMLLPDRVISVTTCDILSVGPFSPPRSFDPSGKVFESAVFKLAMDIIVPPFPFCSLFFYLVLIPFGAAPRQVPIVPPLPDVERPLPPAISFDSLFFSLHCSDHPPVASLLTRQQMCGNRLFSPVLLPRRFPPFSHHIPVIPF